MRQSIDPPTVFPSLPHGFSQAVATTGRRTLYVSGQVAWDAQRRLVGGASLADQARQAFANLRSVVEAAGGTIDDVVTVRLYLVNYRPEMAVIVGTAFREAFGSPAKPASTWLGVTALADPALLIEVEAVAVLD